MPARPRLTTELMDLLDDATDRYRTDPLDPAIGLLLADAGRYALEADQSIEEIVVVARRGTNAPRRKQIKRDRIDPDRPAIRFIR